MSAALQGLPLFAPRSKLDRAFEAFHAEHPEVFATLVRLARQAVARGHTRIGIKMLFEVARWELFLNARSEEEYALNNSYTSRYARRIASECPDLSDVFELRELRS